jgi:serine/threonine protein kinase
MELLLNRYRYNSNDLIGKGGFSKVYKCYDLKNKIYVAIKIDEKVKYNKKESNIYDNIYGLKYMAEKLDYFELNKKSYLVMPLYQYSSDKICKINPENYFNQKDVLMLAIQILQQLNNLHKVGIIHQDIKPDNIIFDKACNKFKIIDFGLSKQYIKNEKHIEFKKGVGRCGTMRYMSINSHSKFTLSRRDDLISLSYSLIYLCKKTLPWKNLNCSNITKNKNKLHTIIKKSKKEFDTTISNLDLPSPILVLYNYSMSLKYNKMPDYNFLIKGFYNYLKLNGLNYDGHWSWSNIL